MSQVEELDDSFLDIEPEQVAEVEVETVEAETVEAEKTETTETVEEPEKEETTESETTTDEKESWTFSQAMDEREKRQAAVKRADLLQEKLDALEKPKESVSVFEDEKGYTEQQQEERQAELNNAMLGMSKAYAERDLGKDIVSKAEKWYADEGMKSPHAIERIHNANLKFHEVVDLYNEEQARLDPDAYKAKLKAEILEELKSEIVEDKPKSITPSLASKRSSGTEKTPVAEDFEDMLGD